jgi:hypothetical protein
MPACPQLALGRSNIVSDDTLGAERSHLLMEATQHDSEALFNRPTPN